MALSAVSCAVTTIGNLIANEAISLWGLEDQVNRLQTELTRMLRFLKEADSRQGESERIRLLVSEVRELAYDAEDVVEVFGLKIGTRRKGTGFSNTIKRWACVVNEGWELYRTRSNIEMIVTRISDFTRRLQASGVQVSREGEESSSSSLTKHDFRQTYPRIIEANVVGLKDKIENLVSVLLDDQSPNHRVVSICGMGGLPLGILVLGGILTGKCSVNEWETVLQTLKSYSNRGGGPWITDVLALSYDDLPSYLRPCFLYLSQFPEDYDIHVDRLIQLWVAEGIVSSQQGKEDGGETAEDVAEGYLIELAERQMIQVGERDAATSKIEAFHMHDVMRDLCLAKATQENFIFIDHHSNAPSLFPEKRKEKENARSLFLQKKRKGNACLLYLQKKRKQGNACLPYLRKKKQQQQQQQQQQEEEEENTSSLLSTPTVRRVSAIDFVPIRHVYTPRLRSLLFFSDFFLSDVIRESETRTIMNLCGSHEDPTSQILNYEGAWRYTCKHFKLLRVLNYEETINIEGECKLPSNIGNLIHLRFLSLRALSLPNLKLPSSLGNLISIETLDLRVGDTVHVPYVLSRKKHSPVQVPDVIWRMEQLRHLYLPDQCKTKTKLKLGTLRNLQTLVNFNTDICYLKDLIKMVNIRVLAIRGPFKIDDFDTKDLDKNPPIVQGKHLHSLSISSYKKINPAHLTHLLSTCFSLCKLSLDVEISELPEYHCLSANLAHVYLRWCKLKKDPMPTLGKLPDLRVLEMGNFAFVGKEMVCHGQGFPKLHCLSLWGLNYLEEWKVDDGAMPSLQRLKINYCPDLKLLQLPDRLKMLL
ncbi:hypothetical protein V6N12_029335 [Hibiscus sabdariffa]|uniref:Uncharacterized protein n=1 Tax=Hibiscus sabdariffa TaxID=183260 RepID=A0ABR2CVU0_9ROSI